MPKVSVVVPIFGVEKYIERCTRSLFEQTLEDMEFVFVDDCTKDNSIAVLEKVIDNYPNRKFQIKIIHHEQNKGLSYARKTGVDNATGYYIGFCDSDDWVDRTMYEKLYNRAISGNFDYVKCGHTISDGENSLEKVLVSFSDNDDRDKVLSQLLRWKGINSIWDTLIKREIYSNNICYTKNAMLEDFFISIQLISNSSLFGTVQEPLYYYYQNPDSICSVPTKDAVLKRCKQAEDNILWAIEYLNNNYNDKYNKKLTILKSIPRRMLVPIMNDYSNYSIWKNTLHGNFFSYFFSPHCTLQEKAQYALICLRVYPIFKRLKSN